MPRPAILFDAFGTLLHIREPRHPYRQLLKLGKTQGRPIQPHDTRLLMQECLDLAQAADRLGIALTGEQQLQLEQRLQAELASIEPYIDGVQAVALLQQQGIPVAVCSNLAAPYRQAILQHYPTLDAYGLSCEQGAMKPDAAIYLNTCQALGAQPRHTLMIGDSLRCDRQGPRELGIEGFFLQRNGYGGDYRELLGFAQDVLATRCP